MAFALLYKAFISYSHRDKKWATWLHRRLERYRIPKHIVQKYGLPDARLSPVFRDREELPAASGLGAEIEKALRASESLIVLCSPAAAASHWVNEEIRMYRALGRGDRIFALIVDGEPPECFPESLTFDDASGAELEHLAADARPEGDGRSVALLKLMAGLLEVRFDELRQREHRRRLQQMAVVTAGALSLTVLTSALAVVAVNAQRDAERRQDQSEDLISFMVGDLRAQLKPIGRLAVLRSVGDKALDYFASVEASDATPEVLLRRAQTMHQLGEVYLDLGEQQEAVAAFTQSLDQTKALAAQSPDDDEVLFELSQAEYWLGAAYVYACRSQCDPDSEFYDLTEQHWGEYARLSVELATRAPDEVGSKLEVAWSANNLGQLAYRRQRFEKAVVHYEAAADQFRRLVASDPDDDMFRDELGNVLAGLGKSLREQGRVVEAAEVLREAIAVNEGAAPSPSRAHSDALWTSYLARSQLDLGEVEAAIASYETALEDAAAVATMDPENTLWRFTVASTAAGLARAQAARGIDVGAALATARSYLDPLLAVEAPYPNWSELDLEIRCLRADHGRPPGPPPTRGDLEQFATNFPNAVATWARCGLLLANGETGAARTALVESVSRRLDAVLEARPSRDVLMLHARAQIELGRASGAVEAIERMLGQGDRDPELLRLAGRLGLSI